MRLYLLDEHIPGAYREQLVYHDSTLTVLMIGDEGAPPRGASDPEILKWCEQNGFILITNNRDSMPQHLVEHLAAGRHVPSIITINLKAPMGVILEDLMLIAGASFDDEYFDQILYVPL